MRRGGGGGRGFRGGGSRGSVSGRTTRGAFTSTRSGGYLSYRNRILIGGTGSRSYIISNQPYAPLYVSLAWICNSVVILAIGLWIVIRVYKCCCYKNQSRVAIQRENSSSDSSSDAEKSNKEEKTTREPNQAAAEQAEEGIQVAEVKTETNVKLQASHDINTVES